MKITSTRIGLGAGKGIGYKNLVPMDKYVHQLAGKGVKTYAPVMLDAKLSEIAAFRNDKFSEYEVREIFQRAIRDHATERLGIYLPEIIIKNIKDNWDTNTAYAESVKEFFGAYPTIEDYDLAGVTSRSFYGGYIRELKDKVIIGRLGPHTGEPYSFATSMHELVKYIKTGKRPTDLRETHELIEPIKQQLYQKSGEVDMPYFKLSWFQNGNVRVIFKSNAEAESIYSKYQSGKDIESKALNYLRNRYKNY